MFARQRPVKRSESKTRKEKQEAYALSIDVSSKRHPAIDLRTIEDVPTAACVEMARAIMKRPDIQTGSFFKLVSASRHAVNKSDAVIVIATAILHSIGNHRAAERILSRSVTVARFYETMRLDDDRVRDSFCVMLFAIAPEFVKMVESALSNALDKVKEMTDAPHAGRKLLDASGELMREGSISTSEHKKMMNDFSTLRINPDGEESSGSIQATPTELVGFSDSVSRIGDKVAVKDSSPVTTFGLMRYVKDTPTVASDTFYAKFPDAARPVEAPGQLDKKGLGFQPASSAFSDNMSETEFSTAMNDLMAPKTKKNRHLRVDSIEPFKREAIRFVSPTSAHSEEAVMSSAVDPMQFQIPEFVVSREDIAEKKKESGGFFETGSKAGTTLTKEDESLLDLL